MQNVPYDNYSMPTAYIPEIHECHCKSAQNSVGVCDNFFGYFLSLRPRPLTVYLKKMIKNYMISPKYITIIYSHDRPVYCVENVSIHSYYTDVKIIRWSMFMAAELVTDVK